MDNWTYAVIPPLMVWFGIWWYLHRTNAKLKAASEIMEEYRSAEKM